MSRSEPDWHIRSTRQSKGQAADRFILACLVYFVGMFLS
jgi:hypothetical protein